MSKNNYTYLKLFLIILNVSLFGSKNLCPMVLSDIYFMYILPVDAIQYIIMQMFCKVIHFGVSTKE